MKKSKKTPRILGSSLSDLIEKFSKEDVISQMEKEYSFARSKDIPLNLIKDNHYLQNIKLSEESVNRLAKGLKDNGIYAPILVREYNGKYELVLGRKRYFAAKQVGFEEVPCVIGDFREEEILLILLADARDQRESNVIEIAVLCKELSKRFHYTQKTLGEVSHQSRSQITNIMRLLTLPDNVILDIEIGKLSYGHAKAIRSLTNEEICSIIPRIYSEKLSVRDVENIVKNLKKNEASLSNALSEKFDCRRVDVRKKSVTFNFENEEDVHEFLSKITSKK